MKLNKLFTSALLAVGLISSAVASSTYTDGGGVTWNVVYITGSTAFRSQVYNAVNNIGGIGNGGMFDAGGPTKLQPANATGSSGQYAAWGLINGVHYILDFDWTGSEAGIAAVCQNTITYQGQSPLLPGPTHKATITLPGTPDATGYTDPATGVQTVTAHADLAFADTSFAVSLSTTKPAPSEYGVVAVIPFELLKGYNSAPDNSWNHLVNVTIPQFAYLLPAGFQTASFFTGVAGDTDTVYLVGRNKGSGTRVNTTLVGGLTPGSGFIQYVASDASYVGTTLTCGAQAHAMAGPLVTVNNDGYDSGKYVAYTLDDDTALTGGQITLGYVGIGDGNTAVTGVGAAKAVLLTLDGVAENDGNVIEGTYSFWGHEHLYGTHGLLGTGAPGDIVGNDFIGAVPIVTGASGTINSGVGANWTAVASPLEMQFLETPLLVASLSGGHQANLLAQSTAIDPLLMACDKPSDAGYPSQQ